MPRRLALILTLSLLLTIPAIVSARTPQFRSTRIVPGRSVGGVSLGMTVEQVRAAWGPGGSCKPARHPWICAWDGIGTQASIDVSLRKGRVAGFSLTPGSDGHDPRFEGSVGRLRTAARIGLGSSEAALVAAYPALKTLTGVRDIGVTYELRTGKHRTQFAVDPDRRIVTSIGLG